MKGIVVAVALAVSLSTGGRSAAAPQEPPATPVAASANIALVEDIIRLWRANLSEEIIHKYIAR